MWKIKTIRRLFDLGATPTEARWVMNDLPVPAMAAALSQEALAMIDILERNMPEQLAADRKAEAEYAPLARDMGDGVVDDRNATPSDTATPPVDPGDGEPDGSVDTIGQWDVPTDLPRPAGRPAPVHASGRPERRHQGRVPAPRRERGDTTGPTGRRRRDMWADAPADRARPRAPGETPRAIFAMLPHVCRETAPVSGPDRMAAEAGPTRRNNPTHSSGLVALWWKIVGHDHLPGREPPVERITPNHGSALLFHKVRRHGEAGARHFVIATDRTHAMAEVPVGFAQCRIAPPFGRARSGGDHWTGAYPADNLGRDSRRSNHAAR